MNVCECAWACICAGDCSCINSIISINSIKVLKKNNCTNENQILKYIKQQKLKASGKCLFRNDYLKWKYNCFHCVNIYLSKHNVGWKQLYNS